MTLKENIANAAIDLFSRNGIKRVSMDEVARKSNVSKRTLYDFYSDKETLLIESLRYVSMPLREYVNSLEANSHSALEILLLSNAKMMEGTIWFCKNFYDDIKRFPNANEFWEEQKQFFLNMVVKLLKRGVKENVFLAEVNFDIISFLAQESMHKRVSPKIYSKYTHEEIHNTMVLIFLRGICTDEGRKILDRFMTKQYIKKRIVYTKRQLVN